MFTALVAELRSSQAAGLTACELEDLLAERGREVLRQLLQDHLDLRAAREQDSARENRPAAVGADGITRNRLEAGHHRMLSTLVGTVRVRRCAWRCPGAGNFCPADAALSLPACRPSHPLARLAVQEAVRGSFEAAHAAITGRCGRQAADRAGRGERRRGHHRLLRCPHPAALHAIDAAGHLSRRQGDRDAARGAAAGHCQGRRPSRPDAHPAGGRGEIEPQADGHPGMRV
jgi:hypothetical protein